MKVDEDLVMALPRKLVESTILGYTIQSTSSLSNLSASNFRLICGSISGGNCGLWFRKIQRLRMKPQNRTGSAKFYFDLLFDYPFGGVVPTCG